VRDRAGDERYEGEIAETTRVPVTESRVIELPHPAYGLKSENSRNACPEARSFPLGIPQSFNRIEVPAFERVPIFTLNERDADGFQHVETRKRAKFYNERP
jgi:hypothetical protein